MSDDVPVLQSRDVAEEMTRDHGPLSALLLQHESTELRWYAPTITDAQTPHDRDELYVVIAGRGWFVLGEERVAFRPGDALFVAANRPHRFVDFTPDLRLGDPLRAGWRGGALGAGRQPPSSTSFSREEIPGRGRYSGRDN